MLTALIDYESGNLHSAIKAFEVISNQNSLGSVKITSDPDIISSADKLVLPGDGAFPACKHALERSEIFEALKYAVFAKGTPFLGICVGMQMLASKGFENGEFSGLDWIQGSVKKISRSKKNLKIPHMGWNNIKIIKKSTFIEKLKSKVGVSEISAYFVHSYNFHTDKKENKVMSTYYGQEITAMVSKENMIGVQFHPEKSHKFGLSFLETFIENEEF